MPSTRCWVGLKVRVFCLQKLRRIWRILHKYCINWTSELIRQSKLPSWFAGCKIPEKLLEARFLKIFWKQDSWKVLTERVFLWLWEARNNNIISDVMHCGQYFFLRIKGSVLMNVLRMTGKLFWKNSCALNKCLILNNFFYSYTMLISLKSLIHMSLW